MIRRNLWKIAALLLLVALAYYLRMSASGPWHIIVSRETTYVTEPLRSDGSVNYVAALNRHFSQGVTPENNASVLFWQAIGPKPLPEPDRDLYFSLLGIPTPPDNGKYLVPSEVLADRLKAQPKPKLDNEQTTVSETIAAPPVSEKETIATMLETARTRPWSKEEFGVLAQWLEENEEPLALMSEGCNRPRRFDPLVSDGEEDGSLLGINLSGVQAYREFARLLAVRAMFRAHENRIDEAWSDLMNCHRLARLVGQGATAIDLLSAIAIDGIACEGDKAMLQHVNLSAAQLATMRADLDRLPPMAKAADIIELGERLTFLDALEQCSRRGFHAISEQNARTRSSERAPESIWGWLGRSNLDWNLILSMSNSTFDQFVARCRIPRRFQRVAALDKFQADLQHQGFPGNRWKSLAFTILYDRRRAISEQIGLIFQALLMPGTSAIVTAEDTRTATFELDELAFALAAYRADHGSYPETLDSLTPPYLGVLPKDVLGNDADFHYQRDGDGYLMYSVGRNGVDDGGRTREERTQCETVSDWDDIPVRMPAKQ